MFKKKAQDS